MRNTTMVTCEQGPVFYSSDDVSEVEFYRLSRVTDAARGPALA